MGRLERLKATTEKVGEGEFLGNCESIRPELRIKRTPWVAWQNARAWEA